MPADMVVLTGATGFVGSHVAEAFVARGVRLRVVARASSNTQHLRSLGVEIVTGPLDDPHVLATALAGSDAVVHMAAVTGARTEADYERVNSAGTQAVLAAANRAATRRFIYLSSLAAVGPSVDGPVTAGHVPKPLTAYGRTKLAGELACADARDGLEVVIIRAPAVYGPRDRELLRLFRLAALGVLPIPTGPARRIQLVHAADLAAAIVTAATTDGVRGVYHVAEERAYEWSELLEQLGAAVGKRGLQVPVPAALIRAAAWSSERLSALAGRSTVFNREKAEELLAPGWLCETERARVELAITPRPLSEGLRDTARWYRDQGWL